MPIKVKAVQKNLSYAIFVPDSERAKSHDLYKAFKSLIDGSKEVEHSWTLSDWIIARMRYPYAQDIEYDDGGFEVSNIVPVDVKHFLDVLTDLCEKLKLKLISETQS